MKSHAIVILSTTFMALGGCGDANDEAALTSTENRELDEAAAALDAAQAEYEAAIQTPPPQSADDSDTE